MEGPVIMKGKFIQTSANVTLIYLFPLEWQISVSWNFISPTPAILQKCGEHYRPVHHHFIIYHFTFWWLHSNRNRLPMKSIDLPISLLFGGSHCHNVLPWKLMSIHHGIDSKIKIGKTTCHFCSLIEGEEAIEGRIFSALEIYSIVFLDFIEESIFRRIDVVVIALDVGLHFVFYVILLHSFQIFMQNKCVQLLPFVSKTCAEYYIHICHIHSLIHTNTTPHFSICSMMIPFWSSHFIKNVVKRDKIIGPKR